MFESPNGANGVFFLTFYHLHQGVRAVIAESYEKIHKEQLVGIGIPPLQFLPGDSAESLGLSGKEQYSISIPASLAPGDTVKVKVHV